MISAHIESMRKMWLTAEMVKISNQATASRENYHHGDLPNVLVREAAELLAERGANGFSMREVARRAGVAVAAPSNHFKNASGLLTAVGVRGFEQLISKFERAIQSNDCPIDRVVAFGKAYLELAQTHPGYADVMFRPDLIDSNNDKYMEVAPRSFALFREAVLRAARPGVESDDVSATATTIWAAMHGFATLPATSSQHEKQDIVEYSIHTILSGMNRKR